MYQPKDVKRKKNPYFFKDIATGKWLRRDTKARRKILNENKTTQR